MTTKINEIVTDLFCMSVIGHPRCGVLRVLKPYFKTNELVYDIDLEILSPEVQLRMRKY